MFPLQRKTTPDSSELEHYQNKQTTKDESVRKIRNFVLLLLIGTAGTALGTVGLVYGTSSIEAKVLSGLLLSAGLGGLVGAAVIVGKEIYANKKERRN